jgi:hypothetical protein
MDFALRLQKRLKVRERHPQVEWREIVLVTGLFVIHSFLQFLATLKEG